MNREQRRAADKATKTVCAQIAGGQHDIAAVGQAIQACIAAGHASMRWYFNLDALELDGVTGEFDEDDLTLNQADVIERVSGVPWTEFDPTRSARLARPLLVAALESCGIESERGESMVAELKLNQILECIQRREVRPADPI